LFVATANSLDAISDPLRDRMDVIELSGYTLEEKIDIARRCLLKKAIENSGLINYQIAFDTELITYIVEHYTNEAGVRQLERVMQKLCSKMARSLVERNEVITFTKESLGKYLGACRFDDEDSKQDAQIGISNGLAWTAHGGKLLKIEVVLMSGRGKLLLTGQLGDVMKESAQAALSYARANAKRLGISEQIFSKYDVHIHVPSGAIPKDGPSAGITMFTALVSAMTSKPVSSDYAMTGELNLRGQVMSIGGIKEKILAAKRNNIMSVILPKKNKHHVEEFKDLVHDMELIFVEHVDEVLEHVLLSSLKRSDA
jgi:ATP-dependent Lon protease